MTRMSTVDPRIARAQRAERRRGPAGVLFAVLVALLHLALWALAGYGGGQMLDSMRLMAVNRVGEGWDSPYDGMPVLFLVGVVGGSILGFFLTSVLSRFLSIGAATIAPLLTGAAGIAAGLAIFSSLWTPPEKVGYHRGLAEGDPPEPWDTGVWIAYALPIWLPLLFAVVAFVLAITFAVTLARAQRKSRVAAELVETGRKVRGTVTEVRDTGVEVSGLPFLEFTVRFQDAEGTDRWVTKKGTFPPAEQPRAGDPVAVWFDPLAPGDQKRILVGLGPDAASVAAP